MAANIAVTTTLFNQTPTVERAQTLDTLMRPDVELSVVFREGETLPVAQRRQMFFSNLDKTLRRALNESLDVPFWFDTTRYPNHIDVRVEVDNGYLRFIAARERVFAPSGFMFIFWLTMATFLLSLVSYFFIKNQTKPIRELADAADAFGKGMSLDGYKPSGASEVRRAGQSFLKMRQRIHKDEIPTDFEVRIRPVALRRALMNLISNSIKYADGCELTISVLKDRFQIHVDDAGPGIAHGGSLTLNDSPLGGLRATFSLLL